MPDASCMPVVQRLLCVQPNTALMWRNPLETALINRMRTRITRLRFRFTSTDELIARVADNHDVAVVHAVIDVLKERLAHQDGSLESVDWSGAPLNDVLLASCRLAGARFHGASLRGAYFGYSDLKRADFTGADLRDAHFREAQLASAEFTGANLQGVNFARANLRDASLAQADLTGANFWEADLRGMNLDGALMPEACFHSARMDRVDESSSNDGPLGALRARKGRRRIGIKLSNTSV